MLTSAEFQKIRDEFLETQDDTVKEGWYIPNKKVAAEVLERLEMHLFEAEYAKEARRKQWEEMRKEFGS